MKYTITCVLFLFVISCNNTNTVAITPAQKTDTVVAKTDTIAGKSAAIASLKGVAHDSVLVLNADTSLYFNNDTVETGIKFNNVPDGSVNEFWLKQGHPNGTEFIASYKKWQYGKDLFLLVNYDNFDEWGSLKDGFFCQAAFHHFDSGSDKIVVLAIGNGIDSNSFYVLKYTPDVHHKPDLHSTTLDFSDWKILQQFKNPAPVSIRENLLYKLDKNKVAVDSILLK